MPRSQKSRGEEQLAYATFPPISPRTAPNPALAVAVRRAPIELDRKLVMQLATSHAVPSAAAAVDLLHAAAGTSAIRDEQPSQRRFRDIHTLTQHAFSSAQRFESVGALMLDTEADWGFFPF